MKNYNQVEVILFSKCSLRDFRQKELVRWLGTIEDREIEIEFIDGGIEAFAFTFG
jgi:hypothetical protein